MSEHSINLRSENPALLVEFTLPPGTHARIGSALNAEISLPVAGIADFARMIGRSNDGQFYIADSDGDNLRHIDLPAALPLPPYQFVIFQPAKQIDNLSLSATSMELEPTGPALTTRLKPTAQKIQLLRDTLPVVAIIAVVLAQGYIFGFINSWSVGLAPALIYRYAVYKRAVEKIDAFLTLAPTVAGLMVVFKFCDHVYSGMPPNLNPLPWVVIYYIGRWIMTRQPGK